MFDVGMPLKNYVVEGSYKLWNKSLENPEKYVTWIIADSGNKRDSVSRNINNKNLLKEFKIVYQKGSYRVYKNKNNTSEIPNRTGI